VLVDVTPFVVVCACVRFTYPLWYEVRGQSGYVGVYMCVCVSVRVCVCVCACVCACGSQNVAMP